MDQGNSPKLLTCLVGPGRPVGPRKPQENEAELLVKRVCESLDGTLGEGREGGKEGGSIAWGWW